MGETFEISLLRYTPENYHGTPKLVVCKRSSFSKGVFPGSMLVFGGDRKKSTTPEAVSRRHQRGRGGASLEFGGASRPLKTWDSIIFQRILPW